MRPRSKKGNILDLIYVIPLVVMIVIVLVFMGAKQLNNISANYQDRTDWDPAIVQAGVTNNDNTIKAFNTMPIVVVGIAIIGAIFLASYLDVNGGLLFFIIIIFLLAAGGTFIYSNVLDNAVPVENFATERGQMPEATNLIRLLPYLIIGGGVIMLVVLYSRTRSG